MMLPKRPTKRERLAAIMAEIGDIPELPPEAEEVVIREDDRLLTFEDDQNTTNTKG